MGRVKEFFSAFSLLIAIVSMLAASFYLLVEGDLARGMWWGIVMTFNLVIALDD